MTKNLQIRTNTIAYKEGQQAFHAGLDNLDDNPYYARNLHGALAREFFEWDEGYEEAYQVYQKALDKEYASTKTNP